MAFHVTVRGVQVACDSADEALVLAVRVSRLTEKEIGRLLNGHLDNLPPRPALPPSSPPSAPQPEPAQRPSSPPAEPGPPGPAHGPLGPVGFHDRLAEAALLALARLGRWVKIGELTKEITAAGFHAFSSQTLRRSLGALVTAGKVQADGEQGGRLYRAKGAEAVQAPTPPVPAPGPDKGEPDEAEPDEGETEDTPQERSSGQVAFAILNDCLADRQPRSVKEIASWAARKFGARTDTLSIMTALARDGACLMFRKGGELHFQAVAAEPEADLKPLLLKSVFKDHRSYSFRAIVETVGQAPGLQRALDELVKAGTLGVRQIGLERHYTRKQVTA